MNSSLLTDFSQERIGAICRDWSGNPGGASRVWVNGPPRNVENRGSYTGFRR